MKKINLLLCFSLCASPAFANFNGSWQGQGQIQHSTGENEDCTSLQIDIQQTETVFLVTRSEFRCGSMVIKNKAAVPLDIRDGHLWWGTTQLGTISETEINTSLMGPDGRAQSYHLQLAEGQLHYSDSVDWTSSYRTQVSGALDQK